MGPRKSGVWQNFSEITIDEVTRAKCHFCNMNLVSSPEPMQKNLDKCAANDTEKEKTGPSSMKQTKLSVQSFSTSKFMQHQIELQVTGYIVASNTALLCRSELNSSKSVFTMLWQGIRIDNRQKVSGPLLDEVYGEEKTKVANSISGCNATLTLDGWSTRSIVPIVGVSITTSSKGILVNTVDTMGHPHTIDYLVDFFSEQVEILRQRVESQHYLLGNRRQYEWSKKTGKVTRITFVKLRMPRRLIIFLGKIFTQTRKCASAKCSF